jgi:hypothetical protein
MNDLKDVRRRISVIVAESENVPTLGMDFSFLSIMIENRRSTNKADTLSIDVQ